MRPWERGFRTELQKPLPNSPRPWVQWVCFTDLQAEAQTLWEEGALSPLLSTLGSEESGTQPPVVEMRMEKVKPWLGASRPPSRSLGHGPHSVSMATAGSYITRGGYPRSAPPLFRPW